ncbi:MAG: hypothetical protein CR988_06470 [Treponema sp.]|nr:MAG: hypothetical protein CR988_06470 [Treponema sp.]
MHNFEKQEITNTNLDTLIKSFSGLADDWMLVTSGTGLTRQEWNTMTAAWGGFGILWNIPVAHVYIRPTRHTLNFTENNDYMTLSFFNPKCEKMKDALKFCGTKSGRDFDKAKETGLKPMMLQTRAIGFEQAETIIVCRKIYTDYIKPECFLDQSIISDKYPLKDFHKFYVCEITALYKAEK